MSKLPAFQFYPADWRKDIGVQSLTYHDRGVWLEILCLMHESEQRGKLLLNGKPVPNEVLSRILGLDKQKFEQTLENLLLFGVASIDDESGALMSRRMVKDEYIRQIRKEAGKKGGNPDLLNQNSNQNGSKTKTEVKQKSTPSFSSSSSSSLKEKNKKTRKSETSSDILLVFDYWRDTLNHPKAKLDNARKAKIKQRLNDFSVADLKLAIDGVAKSDFHLGDNDRNMRYDDFKIIFRDAAQVEKFIALTDQNKKNGKPKFASTEDYLEWQTQQNTN